MRERAMLTQRRGVASDGKTDAANVTWAASGAKHFMSSIEQYLK